MTPANIIGMAKLKELDVIAITDHNTCRNCAPAMQLGEENDLLVIPGMELTTQEEVHVVCLFSCLADALGFDEYVYRKLQKVENKEEIFGQQIAMDQDENILYHEPYLLINATDITFSEVFDLMKEYHGIMIPAHIDKTANSLLSNLGFIPPDSRFTCVELKNLENLHRLQKENPYLMQCNVITDSDAHYLWDINEAVHDLYVEKKTRESILEKLMSKITVS